MRIYLSGPIDGAPDHAKAFDLLAKIVNNAGHTPINPVTVSKNASSREQAMKADFLALQTAEAVALLPGWQRSPGARLEVDAALQFGIPILPPGWFQGRRAETGEDLLIQNGKAEEVRQTRSELAGALFGGPQDENPDVLSIVESVGGVERKRESVKCSRCNDSQIYLSVIPGTLEIELNKRGWVVQIGGSNVCPKCK